VKIYAEHIGNYMKYGIKSLYDNKLGNGYASVSESNGGTLIVPFEGAEASSMSFANLTASANISNAAYVRGQVDSYRELWGSMKFHEKDLIQHTDRKASFLKILPGKIDQFIARMAETVSHSLLNGNWICKLTATGDAAGTGMVTVDHPERLTINQYVTLADANSNGIELFVIAINMSTKVVTLSSTQGGSAYGSGLTGYTVAQDAKLYVPGIWTASSTIKSSPSVFFTSLPDSLLSNANGGSATLYGQTKATYPYLQSVNILGSSITATNILEKLFDAFMEVITLGKGMPTSMLCNMTHFANCAKSLELNRQFTVTDKAAGYGWRKINVLGAEGEMEIIGLRDMDSERIPIVDWNAFKFHGADFFERRRHLNGDEFFLERAVTGYTYIVDVRFFGDLIVNRPSHCGIVHTISY